jgi:hypothetical protein
MVGIRDNELFATHAQQRLKDIAKCEGHEYVPAQEELAQFIEGLGPEECSLANRGQDLPNDRGYVPSKNIAKIVKK